MLTEIGQLFTYCLLGATLKRKHPVFPHLVSPKVIGSVLYPFCKSCQTLKAAESLSTRFNRLRSPLVYTKSRQRHPGFGLFTKAYFGFEVKVLFTRIILTEVTIERSFWPKRESTQNNWDVYQTHTNNSFSAVDFGSINFHYPSLNQEISGLKG